MTTHLKNLALLLFVTTSLFAEEKKPLLSTPVLTIKVPKDHFFLVAIDYGNPKNRTFANHSDDSKAKGVDPVLGQMMRVSSEVGISLRYPEKRINSKQAPYWNLRSSYRYADHEDFEGKKHMNVDWKMSCGYNFPMATRDQPIVYQKDGRIYYDYETNIIETPIKPALEEVPTGVQGVRFYQVPFGEVNGRKRYIIILISDDFEKAKNSLRVSNKNPKFRWNLSWFGESPKKNRQNKTSMVSHSRAIAKFFRPL